MMRSMRRPALALLVALVALLALPLSAGASDAPDASLVVTYVSGDLGRVTVSADQASATQRRLDADPTVAAVEPESVWRAVDTTPNDTLFSQQAGLAKIRAPKAWDRTTGDPGVLLAVVDSGVDLTHPDLLGATSSNGYDFVSGDSDPTDENGHGTSVAGIVAGRSNNGAGIAGTCWKCTILPVRVLDAQGEGRTFDVAQGIRYAADQGAKVINLSLSGPTNSTTVALAVAYARAMGAIVVAAAGNQEKVTDVLTVPQYPAATPGVVAVMATQANDQPYSWTYRGSWTDVGAPGCNIAPRKGGGYSTAFCGTSSASPLVTGVLGLAFSAFPQASSDAIESALLSSAVPIGSTVTAAGRIDAAALLDSLAASFPTAASVTRLGSADPIATSVAVSAQVRASAGAAVLARVDDFADALTAGPLAAKLGGPLLLTTSSSLDPTVAAEIKRLGATEVDLVGGTVALSSSVEDALRANGVSTVRRYAGADRFETASRIAGVVGGTSVFLASSSSFADAVGVSALAAKQGRPILLTGRDGLPAATTAALGSLGVTSVTAVGGTAVVGENVLDALRRVNLNVARIAGEDRFATSAAVADATLAAGVSAAKTWLATGLDWRDALVAGPAAASTGAVLLLVNGQLDGSALAWITSRSSQVHQVFVVGGTSGADATVASLTSLLK